MPEHKGNVSVIHEREVIAMLFTFIAGVLTGFALVGLAIVSPLFFRMDRMPTKEEWKAGMHQQ